MNVYVRELSAALARNGLTCELYTRRFSPELPTVVQVEPGLRVHHVLAGPPAPVEKAQLHHFVEQFTDAVEDDLVQSALSGDAFDAIHANYWLSGIAGHTLKHRLGLPLVSTFHTLDRVKAESSPEEIDYSDPYRRARAEAAVIECSDAVLASCDAEVSQLVELYGADTSRVEIIAPGVDGAFFSPGDKAQARRALGFEQVGTILLFVGRIQPLKGADVAIQTLGELVRRGHRARLVIVGGPSGPQGDAELLALHRLAIDLDLQEEVDFVPPQRHELLSTFYRAADCSLVPSLSESFGLVALEAAACGTPVVASAVGGLTSLVENGRTGFLIDPRDAQSFADHVVALITDRDLATSMGIAAAERAKGYTWATAARRLDRLYGQLTERALAQC